MKRIERARRAARNVLLEQDVQAPMVPIVKIARQYATVLEVEMDDEISGMVVPIEDDPTGQGFAIVVNKNHPKTRRRFTLAHELGHVLLHGYRQPHADRGFSVRRRDPKSAEGRVLEEIEANQFAAELLMPRDMILERVAETELEYAPLDDSNDEIIADLAKEFGVSKSAISIRLANILA